MIGPAYKIKTKRLELSCFEPLDAYLLKNCIDDSLTHLKEWLTWAKNEPETIEAKVNRLRKNRSDFDLDLNYSYGIFLPDHSKLIGVIALMKRIGPDAIEIGYWMHKDYINLGLMTEAAEACVKVIFEVLQIGRIEIHHDVNNLRSRRIPEKLGFKLQAILRKNELDESHHHKQTVVWVLFKDEYEKSYCKSDIIAYNILGEPIL